MSTDQFILIIVDGVNETQENLLLAAIKEASTAWWHEFPNVWMVQGSDNAAEWRDRLRVLFGASYGSLLVVGLPPRGSRSWAGVMSAPRMQWLLANYNNKPPKQEETKAKDEDPWASAPTADGSRVGPSGYDDEPPF